MSLAIQLVAVAALVVSGLQWLRVVQREHYLAGSTLTMYRLWARTPVVNRLLSIVPVGAAAVSVGLVHPDLAVLVASIAFAIFPIGLSLRGRTSPLVWTNRLRRVAGLSAALLVVVAFLTRAVLGSVTSNTPFLNAPTIALLPLILDLALRIAAPIERWLSRRFVEEASATLARINPTVVGITGSFGKTSTKGYVVNLVEGTQRVVASPASFNNRMGLAKAVNEHLPSDADVFVAEMGTYGPGEIEDICSWLPPSIAVMTAIGPVHLERFRSESNIVLAKAEILEPASIAVFNVDSEPLRTLADATTDKKVWRCGTTSEATDVRVDTKDDSIAVVVRGVTIGVASRVSVFPSNLACAIAVAIELGVTDEDIIERVARSQSPIHRQTVSKGATGFSIIDDTFNSNPAGARRALQLLASEGGPQARRVVVTPGMVELGPRQNDENRMFAAAAAGVADDVVLVGRTNLAALREGTKEGHASVIVVRNRQQAVDWVRSHLGPGDVVLYENDLPDHYP